MTERWTIETLKAHYDALLAERDTRYMERFKASELAVELAKTAVSAPKVNMIAVWAIVIPVILTGLTGIAGLVFYLATH